MYGLQVDSRNTLNEIEKGWNEVYKMSEEDQNRIISASGKTTERPPLMLEPLFVIFAGATAAMVIIISNNQSDNTQFYVFVGISNHRTPTL